MATTSVKKEVLYGSIVPPHLLRALLEIGNGERTAIPQLVEDAIEEYVRTRHQNGHAKVSTHQD